MVCSKKKHNISTLIYTYVLDLSFWNAYAVYLWCMERTTFIGPKYSYTSFWMFVAKSITQDNAKKQLNNNKKNSNKLVISSAYQLNHCSLPLLEGKRIFFYFWSEFVTDAPKRKVRYDCPVCKVRFYKNLNCFTFFMKI